MSKWKVGDRVKFSHDGVSDTGTVEEFHPRLDSLLIYTDHFEDGHHRDYRCWWVPSYKLELVKSSKPKRFL